VEALVLGEVEEISSLVLDVVMLPLGDLNGGEPSDDLVHSGADEH